MAIFKKGSLLYADTADHHIFKKIAKNYLEENEVVHLSVKGTFREYLLVTDKGIHIGKGHTFSDKRLHPIYQLGYRDLAAVQSQNAFLGLAYLMLKGYQPPLHQSSIFPVNWMLSMSGSFQFDEAARVINDLWKKWQEDSPIPDQKKKARKEPEESPEPEIEPEKTIKPERAPENTPEPEKKPDNIPDKFAELRKYKALLDDVVILEEEFEEVKKRVLN